MRGRALAACCLLWAAPTLAVNVYAPDGINSVNVYDQATHLLVATIPVGDAPQDAAVTPNGAQVFVINNQSNSVSVIDALSNQVISNIPLSGYMNHGSISRIAITPDGKYCFVITLFGFVALDVTSAVVNPSAAFVSSHTLNGFPQFFEADMAPDGQRLYIPTGIAALQYLLPRPPFANSLLYPKTIPGDPNDNASVDNVAVSTDSQSLFVTNFYHVKQIGASGALIGYGQANGFGVTYGTIGLVPNAHRLFITHEGGSIEYLSLPLTGQTATSVNGITSFSTNGRWALTNDQSTLFVGGRTCLVNLNNGAVGPGIPLPASGVSAVSQPTTPSPGTTPQTISDLSATASGARVTLQWTAPYDGVQLANTSRAVSYEIGFATYSLNIDSFQSATFVSNPPVPAGAGTTQTLTLRGLPPARRVYFEIKAVGEIDPNTGQPDYSLSNVASVIAPASFPAGDIQTYAGNGSSGFSGDGQPSTSARLNTPEGVAVDNNGNVYIADTGNCRIRKVGIDGIINTIVGEYGYCSSGGDGGPALQAYLSTPKDVGVDAAGNVYIADTGNNAIRKVDLSGNITTLASVVSPQSLSIDPAGDVFVASNYSSLVKIAASGAVSTLATGSITGVAADRQGDVFYGDSSLHEIFEIAPGGSPVHVAGNGAPGYSGDGGPPLNASFSGVVRLASYGSKLYVTDLERIRMLDFATNVTTTVAGNGGYGFSGDNGPAASASFFYPFGSATDAGGNLYIADAFNYRIRAVGAPAPAFVVPGAVTDLAATASGTQAAALSWTSPGDNGTTGTLSGSYDIGYSQTPISASPTPPSSVGFNDPAVFHLVIPTTTPAGVVQGATVAGLTAATTYYFALQTTNSHGNPSPLSNVASAITYSAAASTDGVVTLVDPIPGVTVTSTSAPSAYSIALQEGITRVTSIYDLEPSGLSFNPPAQVTFKIPLGVSTATLAIYKFHNGVWLSTTVTNQSIDLVAGTITGYTATSSLYAAFQKDQLPPRTAFVVGQPKHGTRPVVVNDFTPLTFSPTDDLRIVGDDAGVGVAETYYALDASSYSAISSSFSIPGEGLHQVRFYSVDLGGNQEAVNTSTIAVDRTPPVTAVGIGSPDFFAVDGSTCVTSVSALSLSAVDPGSNGVAAGVEATSYSVDSGTFAQYTSSFTLAEGAHAVTYRSSDWVGNAESPKSVVLRVDDTPPATQLVIQGTRTRESGTLYVSTGATFDFAAQDPLSHGVASGVRRTLYSLDGGAFQPFVAAFSLSTGTHVLTFGSVDNVSNAEALQSSTFTIRPNDILPPRTTLLAGQPQYGFSPALVTSSTPFTLSAVDDALTVGDGAGVGVARTCYAVDGAPFAVCKATFTLAGAGSHLIRFYSVDLAGNVESVRSSTFAVDDSAPLTSLVRSTPSADDYVSSATVLTLSAADPVVGGVASGVSLTFVALDTAALVAYSGPFSLGGPEGIRTISFHSVDSLGNAEVLRSTEVVLDETPPVPGVSVGASSFTSPGGQLYVTPQTQVALSATDPALPGGAMGSGVARIEFSVDFASFSAYTGPITFAEGAHTLTYRAADRVGNVSATRTLSLQSDATPPQTTLALSTPSAGGFVSAATLISLSAVDPVVAGFASGVSATAYRIDGGVLTAYAAPFSLSAADGAHAIAFRSVDAVGNAELLRSTTVYLDQTPPVVSVHVGLPAYTDAGGTLYVTPATPVTFTAVDPSSGSVAAGLDRIEVAIDGGAWTDYASALTFAEGRHSVSYRAVDKVGNASATQSFSLRSDATPPVTAFSPSGAFFAAGSHDYAPASLFYALNANDPVSNGVASGVSLTRYALHGGSFQTYASTFSLAEGVQSVVFQSEDHAGNAELVKSATVYVDATAPVSSLSIGAPQFAAGGTLFVSTVTPFVLASQDPLVAGVASGVHDLLYRLDGGALAPYASTVTLTPPEGPRSLAWQAMDNVGNREPLKTVGVSLDATPPVTTLDVIGGTQYPGPDATSFYASSATRFAMISTDAASGAAFTRWQDDGGAFQLYLTTFSLSEGVHALGYQSQDHAANLEVLRSTGVLVDATAPVSTATVGSPSFTAEGGTLYVSTSTPVTLSAADPPLSVGIAGSGLARIEVSVDSAPFASYASALTFTEGRHTVLFRALDNVGNVEAAHRLALDADATPPLSTLAIGQPQFSLSSATVLVSSLTPLGVVAVDPITNGVASGVLASDYRLAPGTATFALFTASFTLPARDGDRTLQFYSADRVLNSEAVKFETLLMDSTPPEVSLFSPHGVSGPGGPAAGICAVVKGKFPVLGEAADPHFAAYRLEFAAGENATTGRVLISSGAVAVSSGTLGVWDASALKGWQTLRLTATDLVQNAASVSIDVFVGDPGELLVLGNDDLFSVPQGVAVDSRSDVYVADTNDDEIQVFSATGAALGILGGDHGWGRRGRDRRGDADLDDAVSSTTLKLNKPQGVAVDAAGNVFIADTNNDRVLEVSATGQVLLSVGRMLGKNDRDRDPDPGQFNQPTDVAVDAAGNVYVADAQNHRVQKLGPDGTPLLSITMPAIGRHDGDDRDDGKKDADAKKRDSGPLGRPVALALDAAGNVYVADRDGGRALEFNATGRLLLTIRVPGGADDKHEVQGRPDGIAVSPDGSCILVSDALSDRVLKFDSQGNLTLVFGAHGRFDERQGGIVFNKPAGLAFAPDGTLLVADRNNDRVERFGAPTGRPTLVTPPDPDDPEFTVKEVVSKDQGGTVARDDKAAVTFPPGALPDDMKVSVSTMSPSSLAGADRMNEVASNQGLKPAYAPVEYGPEGTKFATPVTLTIPYDPKLVAAEGLSEDSLAVRYWNQATDQWQTMPSAVDKAARTVTAKTPHFSLYQVLGSTGTGTIKPLSAADPAFTYHDAYAFPNPSRNNSAVTFRIEPGLADSVSVRVYDLTGRKIHESSDFTEQVIADPNGLGQQYDYEHVWSVDGVASGVYYFVITATKSGKSDVHHSGRVGVIK